MVCKLLETLGGNPNKWVKRRTDTSQMRNGELEDRSEDVTQNAIQRDKEMKYMKKRVRTYEGEVKGSNKSLLGFSEVTFEHTRLRIIQN